jgi:hypothetical protein
MSAFQDACRVCLQCTVLVLADGNRASARAKSPLIQLLHQPSRQGANAALSHIAAAVNSILCIARSRSVLYNGIRHR